MTAHLDPNDPAIPTVDVASAMRVGPHTLSQRWLSGRMPMPDTQSDEPTTARGLRCKAWRLSTLRAWNPAVAKRCELLQTVLAILPPVA